MSKANASQGLVAGLFLLSGLVGLVAGAFWIKGQSFGGARIAYTVVLELDTGSGGLERDAAVKVGGKRKGRVLDVQVVPHQNLKGRPNAEAIAPFETTEPAERLVVIVDVELDDDVTIHPGAKVLLDIPLLGSGGALNIAYTGDASRPALPEGALLVADVSPPPFLRGLDVNEVGEAVDELKQGAKQFRMFMTALAPQPEDDIPPGEWARKIDTVMDNAAEITSDARDAAWPKWKAEVDATLANARAFSENLDTYNTKFNSTLDQANGLFTDGRALVADNREQIDSIIDSADSVMTKADTTWSDEIDTAMETTNQALDQFRSLGADLNTSWDGFRPNVDQILARFRLGADQFKLFTVEVRSQPWRLLHRPDTKELESQLLYDASRSYAQAVSDLRAASASLENVLKGLGSEGEAADVTQVRELMDELGRNRDRQAQAERRLLELMTSFQP